MTPAAEDRLGRCPSCGSHHKGIRWEIDLHHPAKHFVDCGQRKVCDDDWHSRAAEDRLGDIEAHLDAELENHDHRDMRWMASRIRELEEEREQTKQDWIDVRQRLSITRSELRAARGALEQALEALEHEGLSETAEVVREALRSTEEEGP